MSETINIVTNSETVEIVNESPEVVLVEIVNPAGPAGPAGTTLWSGLTGTASKVPFTTTNGGPTALGELAWLAETETLCLRLKNGENLDMGEESIYHVENATGSTITKGTAVSYAGTVGGSGKIRVKPWNGSTDAPEAFMGVAMGDIVNNATGYVTAFGQVRGVNTSAFSDGVILYANPSGTGLTATKPSATHVIACLCVRAANNGTLLVRPVVSEIATWDSVTGKPSSFPNADVTAATSSATPNAIVRRGAQGQAAFSSSDVNAVSAISDQSAGVRGQSTFSVGVWGSSINGQGVVGYSENASGVSGESDLSVGVNGFSINFAGGFFTSTNAEALFAKAFNGVHHAIFGDAGDDTFAIRRQNGTLEWRKGVRSILLRTPASLSQSTTAAVELFLPSASGTLATASTQAQTFLNALPASIPSAILNLDSSTQALKIPSMTETQRNAITSPVAGLLLYNTTTNRPNFHNGSAWVAL